MHEGRLPHRGLPLTYELTRGCGGLWAWSALRVGSVPPGCGRAVFFVTLKNAASLSAEI